MNRLPEKIVYNWLRQLQIVVSRGYIAEKLRSHPYYPSLASITDTLDAIGIDNAAIVVDKNKVNDLPVPFLIHGYGNNDFEIVSNIHEFTNTNSAEFESWAGVIVAAEKPVNWKSADNEAWLAKEKKRRSACQWALAVFSLFSFFVVYFNFTWLTCILLLTSAAGLFISVLLIQQELGYTNPIADKLCGVGENIDCNAVTASKGAKLPFGLSWADAGIIYFSSLCLLVFICLLTGIIVAIGEILPALSALSLLFTFYSVYYQWRVVKKWCMLCMITVGLLWVQAIILFFADELSGFSVTFTDGFIQAAFMALTAGIFLLASIFWLLLYKPLLKNNKKLRDKNFEMLRFRNNPEIFEALLKQQPYVKFTPFENDLQLGNAAAPVQLLIVCNPYCGPCAKAHEQLHALLEKENIGITVRFTIHADNSEDKRTKAVEYILQCAQNDGKNNPGYKQQLLHDWFRDMDLEKFSLTHKVIKGSNVTATLKQHDEWSKEAKIEATPTIFLDGYELPEQYNIEDLRTIIDRRRLYIETVN